MCSRVAVCTFFSAFGPVVSTEVPSTRITLVIGRPTTVELGFCSDVLPLDAVEGDRRDRQRRRSVESGIVVAIPGDSRLIDVTRLRLAVLGQGRLRFRHDGPLPVELVGDQIGEGIPVGVLVAVDEHRAFGRLRLGLDGGLGRIRPGGVHSAVAPRSVRVLGAEQLVEIVTDLVRRRHHRDEVTAYRGAHAVLGGQIVGLRRGDHRGAEFTFDGYDMEFPGQ